jgi:hypothetical protein
MKIALCLSGAPRGDYRFTHFVKKMSEKYDCYLFMHVWDSKSFQASESWSRKDPAEFNYDSIPLPPEKVFKKIENFQDYVPQFTSIYEQIEEQYRWRKDLGVVSMFYGIKQAFNLQEEYEKNQGFEFDCAFRIRFETFVSFVTISNFDLEEIILPSFSSYPINDQFAFSNSNNMHYYASCFDKIVEYSAKDLYHPERILNQHLSSKKLKIKDFGNDMIV